MEDHLSPKSQAPARTVAGLFMAAAILVLRGPLICMVKTLLGIAARGIRPVLLVLGICTATRWIGRAIASTAEATAAPVPHGKS